MKASNISLHIDNPCHENWNNMLPDNGGKFCLSCQKTVVDFTSMTDQQVLNYFNTHKSNNTCGRFLPEQLNREMHDNIASPHYWKYFWQMVIPAVLTINYANGQVKPILQPNLEQLNQNPKQVKGEPFLNSFLGKVDMQKQPAPNIAYCIQVIDTAGKPIPNATINIGRTSTETDSAGIVKLNLDKPPLLTISSIGYNSRQITSENLLANADQLANYSWVNGKRIMTIPVTLQAAADTLSEVVVVGYGTIRYMSVVAGGVSIIRKERTLRDNPKQTVEPSLKVFPNPLTKEQQFSISLTDLKLGKYRIHIIDMQGKLIIAKEVTVNQTSYTQNFEGNIFSSAGIYLIEIHNIKEKKAKPITGKIVVQ